MQYLSPVTATDRYSLSTKLSGKYRRCTLQLWYLMCVKFYRRSKKQFGKVFRARIPTKIISKGAENLGGCKFVAHLIK